ncbi:hypothetical protein [Nostocoides japonicum]|uniref:hypothetical protein n=1 Tax=Nostocoides japonicum TaxID=99481 RepID=UPI0012F9ED71|nr:hypothetical protein [Tetrasphaera japonica]
MNAPPGQRRSPAGEDRAPSGSFGGDGDSIPVIVAGQVLTRREWLVFLDGYGSGFGHGIDRGRQLADDEAAEIHRRAGVIVDRLARLDTHDVHRLKVRLRAVEAANTELARRVSRSSPGDDEHLEMVVSARRPPTGHELRRVATEFVAGSGERAS